MYYDFCFIFNGQLLFFNGKNSNFHPNKIVKLFKTYLFVVLWWKKTTNMISIVHYFFLCKRLRHGYMKHIAHNTEENTLICNHSGEVVANWHELLQSHLFVFVQSAYFFNGWTFMLKFKKKNHTFPYEPHHPPCKIVQFSP